MLTVFKDFVPFIIGGEINIINGWYILLVGYACLTAYVCAVFASKKDEELVDLEEAIREQLSGYEIEIFKTNNADGSVCWNAYCEDFAGIVGTGTTKENATDDLMANVKKEMLFAQIFIEKNHENNT